MHCISYKSTLPCYKCKIVQTPPTERPSAPVSEALSKFQPGRSLTFCARDVSQEKSESCRNETGHDEKPSSDACQDQKESKDCVIEAQDGEKVDVSSSCGGKL